MAATLYEVINLETKEVSLVKELILGNTDDQWTDVTFVEGNIEKKIRFSNIGNQGNLLNDFYAIRQVDGYTPNDDGMVTNKGVEVSNETLASTEGLKESITESLPNVDLQEKLDAEEASKLS